MRILSLSLLKLRASGGLFMLCLFSLLPLHKAYAVTTEPLSCSPEFQITQSFSNSAKWEMCWEPRPGYGYRLLEISFTPPNGVRRKIIDTLHIAQLFVVYDIGTPRHHDLNFGKVLQTLDSAECPAGTLLTSASLCLVHRPTGYSFKNIAAATSGQGESFAVFGYIAFRSYKYVLQYTFFDDGSIEPSVGASGSLAEFGGSSATGWPIGPNVGMNHNHLVIWRMHFTLDGSRNNVVERVNFAGSGSDNRNMGITPISTESKEKHNLSNLKFWRVRNSARNNTDGRNISYEIEPNVTDVLRTPEDFTQFDFYVTQYKSMEELVDTCGMNTTSSSCPPSALVANYLNGETVTDPVVWYGVNFHHVPRGEDDIKMPVHWQSFRIRPRDVSAVASGNVAPGLPIAAPADWYSPTINAIGKARRFARYASESFHAGNIGTAALNTRKVHRRTKLAKSLILKVSAPKEDTARDFYSVRRKAASNCGSAATNTARITSPSELQTGIKDGTVNFSAQILRVRQSLKKCRRFVDKMNQF